MNGWIDEWSEWMDGWMGECMRGWVNREGDRGIKRGGCMDG